MNGQPIPYQGPSYKLDNILLQDALQGIVRKPNETWCRWCWRNLGVISIVRKGYERDCWTHHFGICHECHGLYCPTLFGEGPCILEAFR